ncbi:HAMP domain-containing sensor histidine kinase [Pedococcus aerophilus]|uniref:histidine kinase n=1 Tax=Pedococcus aerophilus TaxID=436356 RepID=A0ABN3USN1_9MICO
MSTLSFAALGLLVSVVLATGTYLTARHFLVEQRQATALRQAFLDAAFVRDGLLTSGARVSDVLDRTSPPPGGVVVIRRAGEWYSSSLDQGRDSIPASVQSSVEEGAAVRSWHRLGGEPVIAVGLPIPSVGTEFYEITPTTELDSTLKTLGLVLAAFAAATSVGGALIGRAASSRVVAPLDAVATAAASIAAGEMDTRLRGTSDPDLAVIVGSFNTMVEALDDRIRRDARFAADVAHELRSPVTTLMTSVALLRTEDGGSGGRRSAVVDLVEREVTRLHRSLEHLLALGRLDSAVATIELDRVDLADLLGHALVQSHRPAELLRASSEPHLVQGDKQLLLRALVNLFDNADLHGGGLLRVDLTRVRGASEVRVVDAGPGVPLADQQRIFERFARVGSRGSRPGTGLGLSLVAETVRAHAGTVWCEPSPGGGATFVVRLPTAAVTESVSP